MNTRQPDQHASFVANIPKYFFYVVFRGLNFGLITAMWVIFLQRQHALSLTQITLIDVAFWIALTLGEIPTGVVADLFGRKISMAVGALIMCVSIIAWGVAPNVLLIVVSYMTLAIGATFLSGAQEALFYESLKITNRASDFTRLMGRASAVSLVAVAVGNLSSGFLATIDLRLPFFVAGASLFAMFVVVLTFKEPRTDEQNTDKARPSYREILQQSVAILRQRPTLRHAVIYMTLVPIAAMAMETIFLQPQALALGVPLAGVGVVVMAVQLTNVLGSTASHRAQARLGEGWVIYSGPLLIAASLLLLGLFQQLPALIFAALISFVTAVLRPIVMHRIQDEVTDNIRATVLSVQSLFFALTVAFVEPLLGFAADQAGLAAAYYIMAAILLLYMIWLVRKSRPYFP